LAGLNVRFDGGNKANEKIVQMVREGKAVPVCPEQLAGFCTPRERIELRNGRAFTESGKDVTRQLVKGAEETLKIARLANAGVAIFKSRSPSCGSGRIYDGSFSGKLVEGNGIAAEFLQKSGIRVLTEEKI